MHRQSTTRPCLGDAHCPVEDRWNSELTRLRTACYRARRLAQRAVRRIDQRRTEHAVRKLANPQAGHPSEQELNKSLKEANTGNYSPFCNTKFINKIGSVYDARWLLRILIGCF